jgi:hypothetical protein
MGKYYGLIPSTVFGWIGLISGIVGSMLAATQFIWDWFGITQVDKALFSVIVLILMLMAIAGTYVGNKMVSGKNIEPLKSFGKIFGIGMVIVFGYIVVSNSVMMTLSTTYTSYTDARLGYLTGLRQLTSVTTEDVNSLVNFALGIRQIVRSMFLIVPALIATWGGLSVLTADSIDEAEGGILAIVSAFVVFIIVFIFKAIDVQLMFLMLNPALFMGLLV